MPRPPVGLECAESPLPIRSRAAKLSPEEKKWKRAGFEDPIISTVSAPRAESSTAVTHAFDLTVVMFRGTGWTYPQVEPHFKRINEIYAQCGIRLEEVKVVESDAYRGLLDVRTPWAGEDLTIAKAVPRGVERPAMFLMRDLPSQMSAYAGIPSYALQELDPAIHDMIFVSDYVNSPDWPYYQDGDVSGRVYRSKIDPSYEVFAHEIAHLLANAGHELPGQNGIAKDEKNLLMGEKSGVSDRLLPRQCEAFKSNPLLREL